MAALHMAAKPQYIQPVYPAYPVKKTFVHATAKPAFILSTLFILSKNKHLSVSEAVSPNLSKISQVPDETFAFIIRRVLYLDIPSKYTTPSHTK